MKKSLFLFLLLLSASISKAQSLFENCLTISPITTGKFVAEGAQKWFTVNSETQGNYNRFDKLQAFDLNGEWLWSYKPNFSGQVMEIGNLMCDTLSDDVYITIRVASSCDISGYYYVIQKIGSDGKLIWSKQFAAEENPEPGLVLNHDRSVSLILYVVPYEYRYTKFTTNGDRPVTSILPLNSVNAIAPDGDNMLLVNGRNFYRADTAGQILDSVPNSGNLYIDQITATTSGYLATDFKMVYQFNKDLDFVDSLNLKSTYQRVEGLFPQHGRVIAVGHKPQEIHKTIIVINDDLSFYSETELQRPESFRTNSIATKKERVLLFGSKESFNSAKSAAMTTADLGTGGLAAKMDVELLNITTDSVSVFREYPTFPRQIKFRLYATIKNNSSDTITRVDLNSHIKYEVCNPQVYYRSFSTSIAPGDSVTLYGGWFTSDWLKASDKVEDFEQCFWTSSPNLKMDVLLDNDRFCAPAGRILSIEDTNEKSGISIYPNPASDKVYLEGIEGPVSIEVVNSLGAVYLTADELNNNSLSVENWPAGMYVVKITSTYGSETLRLLKQ